MPAKSVDGGSRYILRWNMHPNLKGYFTMAEAFYEAMKEKQLIGSWEKVIPAQKAWAEIPVTEVDYLSGILWRRWL